MFSLWQSPGQDSATVDKFFLNFISVIKTSFQGGGRFYHLEDVAQIPAFMTGELALHGYMALADEEKAKEIERALEEAVKSLSWGTPLAAKAVVADSSAFVRKSQDFNKK